MGAAFSPCLRNPCTAPPARKTIDACLCLPLSFALVSDKLYQRKEPVVSSVHTKVKGIAEVREVIMEDGMEKETQTVFDTADYTFPLQVGDHLSASSLQGPAPPPLGPRALLQKNIGPILKAL